MKESIRSALDRAEALDEELRLVGDALGRFEGEQLSEAGTEKQLDRWARERGLTESMDAARRHMGQVLAELQWIHDELGGD